MLPRNKLPMPICKHVKLFIKIELKKYRYVKESFFWEVCFWRIIAKNKELFMSRK